MAVRRRRRRRGRPRRIVAEFFDVGCSRSRPWARRPRAAELLAAVVGPDRAFEAIVVGEYERAFAGGQLAELLPVLHGHGVQLWLPELGGPVDPTNAAHQALLMLLGHQSRREVLRWRFRTMAAMRVQARDQVGIWVVGRHTDTVSSMLDRTRIGRMPVGGGGGVVLIRIRLPLRTCGADLRATVGREQRGRDRADAQPPRHAVTGGTRLGPQPASDGRGVDAAGGRRDLGQPALHGPSGVEPAVHRPSGSATRRQAHQRGSGAAVESERSVGDLH